MGNKNGDIRLCVDFWNSNRASLKDNYPVPNMDRMLQRVKGLEMPSMLDGFSRGEGKAKTIFTTPWGTFAYPRMPV